MEDAAIVNNQEEQHCGALGTLVGTSQQRDDEAQCELDHNEHPTKRIRLDTNTALVDCPETSTSGQRSGSEVSEADEVEPEGTSTTEHLDNDGSIDQLLDSHKPSSELFNSSDDSTDIDMSASMIAQLQGGNNPSPCLLELARFFRAQAVLLRQQAKFLEKLAIPDEIEGPDVDIQEKLYLNHIIYYTKKTCPLLDEAVNKMDVIEDSLFPWVEAREEGNALLVAKKKTRPVHKFGAFSKLNFDTFAAKLGTRRVAIVSKELSAQWKALGQHEKEQYAVLAEKMTRERSEKEELATSNAAKGSMKAK